MATGVLTTRVVSRNDLASNWLLYNPVLLQGELGIEIDTRKIKVGDGVSKWSELGYCTSGFNPTNGALLESITPEDISRWNESQPNTIEKIFVNKSEVSIVNKEVHIDVPTTPEDIGAAPAEHNHDSLYLRSDQIIPAALLPGYLDELVEVENFSDLPNPGESGKLYVVTQSNMTYRWSGSQYVTLSGSLALGETSETAFRGDHGKLAYEHALSDHAPVSAQENIIEIFKVVDRELPVENKTITLPKASLDSYGVVKSSTGANNVTVNEDGTMRVDTISTSSLYVPENEELILDGGSANRGSPTP